MIAEKLPDFKFNPDDFTGLTYKLDDPISAIIILPNGKAICTGIKKIEDAETSIKKVVNKLRRHKFKVKSKYEVETQNIIASIDVNRELHLSSISTGLILDRVNYDPESFPGLIYKMDDIGVILLLFSSGKIVCTGAKNIEDASKALETIKEKLTSIGAL